MINESDRYLISVVGPTAVGKTKLAIELAQWLHTHVLSADSRQFYKELEVGTAKPTTDELKQVPHHFINSHSILDEYDVGRFEKDALTLLTDLFHEHGQIILVGGSGLFCKAIWTGLDAFPPIDPIWRQELSDELNAKGIQSLQRELAASDPLYFRQVDLDNPQRLIRALEVTRATGKPYSSFRQARPKPRNFRNIKIGLNDDRQQLYRRIDFRMDEMIANGLFEEAESLLQHRNLNALQTVGYSEIFKFLEGEYDKKECIRLLKRNSRRYAKRQLTWFNKDREVTWFSPDQEDEVKRFITQSLNA